MLLLSVAGFAQLDIETTIEIQGDGVTYQVYARPLSTSAISETTITDTGQITIVAPTGFTYTDLKNEGGRWVENCLLYTSPSPRDATLSRMPSSA